MTEIRLAATTAAEALLATLRLRGIDYLLANPGTDFAPLIEGLVARAGIRPRHAHAGAGRARAGGHRHGARLLARDRAAAGA